MPHTAIQVWKLRWSGASRAVGHRSPQLSVISRLRSGRRLHPLPTPRLRGWPTGPKIKTSGGTMAYIFHEDELPKLVSAVPGRERTFFVNKELTNIDDMLAGIMRYKQ